MNPRTPKQALASSKRKPKKPRNPVAKALRILRPKAMPDKRRKLRERAETAG